MNFEELVTEALEKSEDEFINPPPGLLTLLNVKNRAPLPEAQTRGRPSLLEDIVINNPLIYAQFISYLRQGAYYQVAAEAIGVNYRTLYEWGKKGKDDIDKGLDTFHSRLHQDIRRAVADCRCRTEQRLLLANPQRWLSVGPGKIFGNEWAESPTVKPVDIPQQIESDTPFDAPKQITEEKSTDVYVFDPEEQLKVLEALEEAGQGKMSESYKEALRKQISEKKDVVPESEGE